MVEPEGITRERFEKVQASYWVCAFKDGRPAYFWYWLFGAGDVPPPPVPNRQMEWRRPTYAEALERQIAAERDPEEFDRLCRQWSESRRWLHVYGVSRDRLSLNHRIAPRV